MSVEEKSINVQYSTVQCSTVQNSTVQYSTVLYSTVQYSTVLYCTVQYCTVQYSEVRANMPTLDLLRVKGPTKLDGSELDIQWSSMGFRVRLSSYKIQIDASKAFTQVKLIDF